MIPSPRRDSSGRYDDVAPSTVGSRAHRGLHADQLGILGNHGTAGWPPLRIIQHARICRPAHGQHRSQPCSAGPCHPAPSLMLAPARASLAQWRPIKRSPFFHRPINFEMASQADSPEHPAEMPKLSSSWSHRDRGSDVCLPSLASLPGGFNPWYWESHCVLPVIALTHGSSHRSQWLVGLETQTPRSVSGRLGRSL